MEKFNLKKAILENKATFLSSLVEGEKEYYKDAEADDAEHIDALEKDMKDDKKSSKMKMSELKAKIKEMALAEMNMKEDTYSPTSLTDFLAEVDAILAEADEEVAVGDEEIIDTTTTTEVDPNVKAVQDALTQAQAAAQKLGDGKLTDQIGNTITFFTRAHVVDQGAVAEGKEMDEGYFGANNEVEELIDALEYETMDEFFSDNPGAITAVLDWAAGIPEFRAKMETSGLLEAKKSTAKLDEIVKDMDHIISFMYLYIDNFFEKNDDRSEDELEVIDDIKYDLEGRKQNVIMKKYKDINSVKDLERYVATNLGKINDEDELDESLNESMFPMLKKILK